MNYDDLDVNKVNELKRKLKDVLHGENPSNCFYSLRWVMIEYCNSYLDSTEAKKKKDEIIEDLTGFVTDMSALFGLKFGHEKTYQRLNKLNKIAMGLSLFAVAMNLYNLYNLFCR
jgi:hypothetical protein